KLYEMPVVFDLIGLMGSTVLVGDRTGWTVDEFNQMVNSLPEGVLPFAGITQENILSNALSFSMSSFVNYGSGEVSFNSEDFIKLLDLAKTYGQDSSEISYGGDPIVYEDISTSYTTGSEDGQDPYTLAQNGLLALMDAYLYSPDMIVNDQITFNGEVTYLGYPNPDKTGLSCQTTLSLAMSAMTEYKDEAWSFISYFLTPDAQADAAADAYSIALDRSVVDDQITQALENAETAGYYMSYGEDMPKLTQADCDRYLSVINAVSSRCISDVSIMAVITEEAAQYFNGQKSAEEVASSIQNRVQLIVDERN
ncbi:MAG TPA: extracellular solute-binding protein, partial [Bacillota bacterium]|nr:extracellular solute-binding protein [Bacillota bacterium]